MIVAAVCRALEPTPCDSVGSGRDLAGWWALGWDRSVRCVQCTWGKLPRPRVLEAVNCTSERRANRRRKSGKQSREAGGRWC